MNMTYKGAVAVCIAALAISAVAEYRERKPEEKAKRIALIAPVADGELRIRPTFNSCGFCWGAAKAIDGFKVECRKDPRYAKAGEGAWKEATAFEYFPETKDYRGSIFYLDEDSLYELKLSAGGRTFAQASFRTWASNVPVARTVTLDPATFKAPMKVTEKGSPTGWIRYVVKDDATLNVAEAAPAFVVENAAYILFDDMTIRGCAESRNVFALNGAKYVRIRNCDIAGWGRKGIPDYSERAGGKLREANPRGKKAGIINWDAAIVISRGCEGCVVERCWIHDPISTANSWFYSHPAGPQAVGASQPDHSTVIRYNDFIGSDQHRWNDAVESGGNFIENGGLNRDADVYGNFMIFCNDDCIELDGGQQNVRCFQNRFEQAVSGVSIQGCMVGPSYTFDNVFTGGGDSMGFAYPLIKTSGISLYGDEACAYITGNEFWNSVGGANPSETINVQEPAIWYRLFNNRFEGNIHFNGLANSPKSVEKGTVNGVTVNRDGPIALPYRPVPFTIDRGMIDGITFKKGVLSQKTVKLTVTTGGKGWSSPFKVAKNDVFDWFDVQPAQGVLKSGTKTEFTVTFNPARLNDRHFYRGAFLVRTKEGFSRPVSVYVYTDFQCPFKPETGDAVAVYVDAFKPQSGTIPAVADAPDAQNGKVVSLASGFGKKNEVTYAFDLPKDGRYFILARGRNDTGSTWTAQGRVDDGEWSKLTCTARKYMSWVPVSLPSYCGHDVRVSGFDLKAGRHTFTMRGTGLRPYMYEGIVVTDNPGLFDPR